MLGCVMGRLGLLEDTMERRVAVRGLKDARGAHPRRAIAKE